MSSFLASVFPRQAGGELGAPEFQAREEGRSSSHLNNTPRPTPADSEQDSSRPSLASSQPPNPRRHPRQHNLHDKRGLASSLRPRPRSRSPASEPPEIAAYNQDKPHSSMSPFPSLPVGEKPANAEGASSSPSPPSSPSPSQKRARRTRKPKNTSRTKSENSHFDDFSLSLERRLHLKKFNPQLVLENSGSVARDHLASERTFLAYVRTSLALSGMGVAIVQLFTLADLTSRGTGTPLTDASRRLQKFARPLGVTAVLLALFVLGIAVYRYFLVQYALPVQKFPVARFSIAFISFVLGAVFVVIFAALLSGRTMTT